MTDFGKFELTNDEVEILLNSLKDSELQNRMKLMDAIKKNAVSYCDYYQKEIDQIENLFHKIRIAKGIR